MRRPIGCFEQQNARPYRGVAPLVDVFQSQMGKEMFDHEFPPWAVAVALRFDPEALLAARAREVSLDGIPEESLGSVPVPALLIAGELEDGSTNRGPT